MSSSNTWFGTQNILPLSLLIADGDVTLTPTQSTFLYIVVSGSLTAAWNLTFTTLGVWQCDTTQIAFSGHHINCNNGTAKTQITTQNVFTISCPVENICTVK